MPEQSIILHYDKDGKFVELFDDPRSGPEEQRKAFALIKCGASPAPDGVHTLIRVKFNTGDNHNVDRWTVPADAKKPTKKEKSK